MAEIVLLRGAEQDLLTLYNEFFSRSEDRAERFSRAVDRGLAALDLFPEIGGHFRGPFRRKLVPGFYEFGIFYALEHDRVLVHAIPDLRQAPEQIRWRLEG